MDNPINTGTFAPGYGVPGTTVTVSSGNLLPGYSWYTLRPVFNDTNYFSPVGVSGEVIDYQNDRSARAAVAKLRKKMLLCYDCHNEFDVPSTRETFCPFCNSRNVSNLQSDSMMEIASREGMSNLGELGKSILKQHLLELHP